jgi:hypothetical protein
MSLYRSSNAKITSDVFKEPLNNSFKDYWHLNIKRRNVLMIQQSGKLLIRLHSGWNKRKLWFGGVRVTYLKINFGFGPNAPRAETGEILKLQPVQIFMQVRINVNSYIQISLVILRTA